MPARSSCAAARGETKKAAFFVAVVCAIVGVARGLDVFDTATAAGEAAVATTVVGGGMVGAASGSFRHEALFAARAGERFFVPHLATYAHIEKTEENSVFGFLGSSAVRERDSAAGSARTPDHFIVTRNPGDARREILGHFVYRSANRGLLVHGKLDESQPAQFKAGDLSVVLCEFPVPPPGYGADEPATSKAVNGVAAEAGAAKSALSSTDSERHAREHTPGEPSRVATTRVVAPAYTRNSGALHVLYLDFDGYEVLSTSAWGQSVAAWTNVPFSLDTNANSYSATELTAMTQIVDGMAEDFAPFDVTVTSDVALYAATPATRRFSAVFTVNTTASPDAAGVCYVGVWGISYYEPCFAFSRVLASARANSEAQSHEVGHALGLNHDGRKAPGPVESYYSGSSTWGPIMGATYSARVVSWSDGTYANANNQQDDVAIIESEIPRRADDHGDTGATATALSHGVTPTGVISSRLEIDTFKFEVSAAGTANLTAWPLSSITWQQNVRLSLSQRDCTTGAVIATAPARLDTQLWSNLAFAVVDSTTYCVAVDGVGSTLAQASGGYNDYASMGYYTLAYSGAPIGKKLGGDVDSQGVLVLDGTQTHTGGVVTSPVYVPAGATLTISGLSYFQGGLNVTGGLVLAAGSSLTVTGSLRVEGDVDLSSGTMNVTGTLSIASGRFKVGAASVSVTSFVLAADGVLALTMLQSTALIVVTGNAQIAGALELTATTTTPFEVETQVELITYTSLTQAGAFTSVTLAPASTTTRAAVATGATVVCSATACVATGIAAPTASSKRSSSNAVAVGAGVGVTLAVLVIAGVATGGYFVYKKLRGSASSTTHDSERGSGSSSATSGATSGTSSATSATSGATSALSDA